MNKEEKALRRELCEKQIELQFKEKYLRRVGVKHLEKVHQMKKEEREKFVGSFAQAKNLIEKQMKLGNLVRDQKLQLNKNKKRVTMVKQDKVQENHVVAIKNKLYDNSALELSTQRSSFIGAGAAAGLAASQFRPPLGPHAADFAEQSVHGELNRSQQSTRRPYRTDSASKPFGIRKPPGPQRNGSVYTSNPRFAKHGLADMRAPHGDTFTQNFKSYRGVAPQALKREQSFTAGYATAADSAAQAHPTHLPPFLNEMDFTGQSKDRLLHQLNRSNKPHVKRILNNQVFLEETEPYLPDDFRKNQYAIEAGQHILRPGQGEHSPLTVLPALGPQPAPHNVVVQSSLFSLPKGAQYHKKNPSLQYPTPAGNMGVGPGNVTSYMTQGEYSHHPIFHT